MGIKDFHKNIKSNYPKSFSNKFLEFYDHILIDINFALHYCSYGAKNEEELFKRLYSFFDYILNDLTPTKSLTVASDGVAPLAKLILQRKRRLNITKTEITKDFSSIMFTTGSEFMINLEEKLSEYFKFVEKSYCIKVNYMDAKIDEAELKLKKKIMDIMEENIHDSFIFVTNDADVIIMLATLKNISNVYVYCKSGKENEILSMGKLLDEHTTKVGITLNYGNDFALINTMLGNDYLPKINLLDFNKIWTAYTDICKYYKDGIITNECKINKKFLNKLMTYIIISLKKGFIKKIKIDQIDNTIYENYFDGLTWCFNMYNTGICNRYDYMYVNKLNPNPFGIICNIKNKNILKLNNTIFDPIDSILYTILVLPQSGKKLIHKKYYDFIDNINKLKYYNIIDIDLKDILNIVEIFKKYIVE